MLNPIYNLSRYDAARRWLELGAALLPVQPGRKWILKGFGPNQKRLTNLAEAKQFFASDKNAWNIAVVLPDGPDGIICLDFDSQDSYIAWSDAIAAPLMMTYQETTRRGMHVFYRCDPGRLIVKPEAGIEIKRTVVVSPSVIGAVTESQFRYSPIAAWPILAAQREQILPDSFLLSATQAQAHAEPKARAERAVRDLAAYGDTVSRIKAAYDLVTEIQKVESVKLSQSANGRWWHGFCPFHGDRNKPSLWVDTERQLWGCYACKSQYRGLDVVNWHSEINGIEVKEAIRDMARSLAAAAPEGAA